MNGVERACSQGGRGRADDDAGGWRGETAGNIAGGQGVPRVEEDPVVSPGKESGDSGRGDNTTVEVGIERPGRAEEGRVARV